MSHKEDLRVREARKAARIVAAERDISYQQALDRIAQDAGAPHWSDFMADPAFCISLSAYRSGALAFEGEPAKTDPVVPFQRMAQGADRVAQSVRRLLDSADRLISEAEGLSAEGLSPSNALGHAALLIDQVRSLAEPLDGMAKDLLSLYEGRLQADRAIGGAVRQHYRDIQERSAMLERRLKSARAAIPEDLLPELAVDHYMRMRFGRSVNGHVDILSLAGEENAPVSARAARILYKYVIMLRNLPSRMDREDGKVLADFIRWTGYALHNLPEISSGVLDANGGWLFEQCRDFVSMARTHCVPDYWHPQHPKSNRWMHGSNLWTELCRIIAEEAKMEPAYGVPTETFDVSDGLQPFPEPPRPTLGMHGAAAVADYVSRVREWAEWHARGRRIVVRRWQPDVPVTISTGDEPYGESVDRDMPERRVEDEKVRESS